jgi:hypothetical protein
MLYEFIYVVSECQRVRVVQSRSLVKVLSSIIIKYRSYYFLIALADVVAVSHIFCKMRLLSKWLIALVNICCSVRGEICL